MQMPHVFVVPPEEEQSPAWCCFDAENPSRPQSREIVEQPVVMSMQMINDTEDPFYRDPDFSLPGSPVSGGSSPETMSVVDALMKDDGHNDYISDTESEYENDPAADEDRTETRYGQRQSRRTLRDVANDSDVIEVVKVSRKKCPQESIANVPDSQQSAGVKRSGTLKKTASKVFKSIRGTLRSKSRPRAGSSSVPPVPPVPLIPPTPQIPTATVSHPAEPDLPQPPKPATLTRRGSRILSQLFTGPSLQRRASMASVETTKSPTSPTVPSHYLAQDMPTQPVVSPPPSLHNDHVVDHHEARIRATSPTPTASSSRSNGRFSKLALHRVFSFSSRSSTSEAAPRVRVNLDDIQDSTPPQSGYAEHITEHATEHAVDIPTTVEEDSQESLPARAESCTPPSVVSRSSSTTTAGPQTPTSTEEVTVPVHVVNNDPRNMTTFSALESDAFKWNSQLNLGLGLGLDLDLTPAVEEVEQKPSRPSFSSLTSMTSWKSLTGKRSGESSQPRQSQTFGIDEEADTSLEMRLDSLHFDDMSFDASQFTFTSTSAR